MKKLLVSLLVFAVASTSFAQNPFDKLKKLNLKKIPDINNIAQGKEPVTTSLEDAMYEAPELDNFEPVNILPANELPRNTDGSFFMFPGVWEFHLKSYCMKAGTYGPSKTSGSGHIYAPLKGAKADIIQSLLKNGFKHPEIKQRDIQVLIWAIIARQSFDKMPKEYMLTAAKLLEPKQLLQLNEGTVRNLAQKELSKLADGAPEPVRQVLEAENKIRGLLSDANTKYEDLENVAVLTGMIPEDEGRKIKKGRWSLTPQGYYIRYFPQTYSSMVLQLYVKEDQYSTTKYITIKNNISQSGGSFSSLKIPNHQLKEFDPSKHPALPKPPGQRLGPSNDKNGPDDRNDPLDKANKILKGADNAQNGFGMATDPLGSIVDKVNPFSPGNMFGHILDFITDNARKISDALNGDPPDADYTNFVMAEPFEYKSLKQTPSKNPALNKLSNEFSEAYLEAYSLMLALAQSNDKLGGAKIARDEFWINKQAQAIIYYKKKVGDALNTACEKWDKYLAVLKAQSRTPILLKPEYMEAYQNKLRSKGFDNAELTSFRFLRMTDAEIEHLKTERLGYNPQNYTGDYIESSRVVLSAWKEYGIIYSKFPSIPAPWE